MKYLLSAYSINPYKGSEDYIGWNWLLLLSENICKDDELYIITKRYNESDVKKGLKEFHIDNVNLIIVDVPKYLNWFREKYSVFHHMYYILWQRYAYQWVKKSNIKFDIIHHVTMNDYRIIGNMCNVKDAYTILGPIGGAQVTPKSLICYEKNLLSAKFRELVNKLCNINPWYKRKLTQFSKIYAINNETKEQLERIAKRKIELLPELALKEEFKYLDISKRKKDQIVRLLFVGRLISKKGIYLLIDILKNIPKTEEWILDIYGDGKERVNFEKLLYKNGLKENVKIHGKCDFAEISNAYRNSDVFIFPSLRETSGNVLLEAMAHGIPIIAINISFASTLKENSCGIFVNPNQSKEKIINEFVGAIMELKNNRDKARKLGERGYKYVNNSLLWKNKYEIIYNRRRK